MTLSPDHNGEPNNMPVDNLTLLSDKALRKAIYAAIHDGTCLKTDDGQPYIYSADDAEDSIMELIKAYGDERVEEARSKDPHECEFGHKIYSHNTADGWCCACEADQAFMEAKIERGIAELQPQSPESK